MGMVHNSAAYNYPADHTGLYNAYAFELTGLSVWVDPNIVARDYLLVHGVVLDAGGGGIRPSAESTVA